MSLLSVAYLLIAIISVGVTIFDIIQARIHAQPKVWRILLYLAGGSLFSGVDLAAKSTF